MTPTGKAFYEQIYPLIESRLTPADLPAFTLLCQEWGRLHDLELNHRQYNETRSFCMQMMKAFGLTPKARKELGVIGDESEVDEFA